jgi:hypothetical protein
MNRVIAALSVAMVVSCAASAKYLHNHNARIDRFSGAK